MPRSSGAIGSRKKVFVLSPPTAASVLGVLKVGEALLGADVPAFGTQRRSSGCPFKGAVVDRMTSSVGRYTRLPAAVRWPLTRSRSIRTAAAPAVAAGSRTD